MSGIWDDGLSPITSLSMLWSIENVTEAIFVIGVLESTSFDTLPKRWPCHGDYDTGSVDRVSLVRITSTTTYIQDVLPRRKTCAA